MAMSAENYFGGQIMQGINLFSLSNRLALITNTSTNCLNHGLNVLNKTSGSLKITSDKFPLLSNQSKCDESQFECENGVCNKNNPLCSDSCVPEYWVNDSEDDCTDASDEIDYDREINCHWSIYAPNSTKLVLTLNEFQVIFWKFEFYHVP